MAGLSPRLSHVVETMAGTQRMGDTPKFRAPPAENRQRFKADSVSLGEGLRSAFAHENRGPTPAQASAIRAETETHERHQEELQRRMAVEHERRSQLLRRDRLEREKRAQELLAAKQRQREEADRKKKSYEREVRRRSSSPVKARPHTFQAPSRSQVVEAYTPPPQGKIFVLNDRRPAEHLNRNSEPRMFRGSSPEKSSAMQSPARQWQVLGPEASASSSPPPKIGVSMLPPKSLRGEMVQPSVMMVPQEDHNVEARLFASRPAFTPKAPHLTQMVSPPQPAVARRPPPVISGAVPVLSQPGSSQMSRALSSASVTSTESAHTPTPPAGIGISFVPDQDGNLLIAHLVPGGPAMLSGQLYIGDRLLSVSGQPVAGKTVPEVIRMILGPKDTEVRSAREKEQR